MARYEKPIGEDIVLLRQESSEVENCWSFDPALNVHSNCSRNSGTFNFPDGLLDAVKSRFTHREAMLFVPAHPEQHDHLLFLLRHIPELNRVLVISFDGSRIFHRILIVLDQKPNSYQLLINDSIFLASGDAILKKPIHETSFSWLNVRIKILATPLSSTMRHRLFSVSLNVLFFVFFLALVFSCGLGYVLWANQRKKDAESKFRHIFEQGNEGYFLIDKLTITQCNHKLKSLFRLTTEEFKGSDVCHFFQKNQGEWFFGSHNLRELFAGKGPHRFEVIRQGDIEDQCFRFNLNTIKIGDQETILCIVNDISNSKKQEKKLRESEKRYRLLVENAPELIFICQANRVKIPNQQVVHVTGYTQEEFEGIRFNDLIIEDDLDLYLSEIKKLSEKPLKTATFSLRILNKEQQRIWLEIHIHEFKWESQPAVLFFVRNVSMEKANESQLFQAKKMEAVGTLAAGVAHDFNNILQAIQGNIDLYKRKKNIPEKLLEAFQSIDNQVKRGSELAKQLLGFSKGGKYEIRPVLINQIVEQTAIMFSRTHKNVRMNYQFQRSLWTVDVDEGQIGQVFLNLFLNADKAMPEGGVITLRIENMTPSKAFRSTYNLHDRSYIRVSVVDTGIGMDEDTLSRIFEPFFTTRENHSGTGMGLASAYGIIKNHNGAIEVKSEVGVGSTFNIYLPVSLKPFQKLEDTTGKIFFGKEHLLVIDDEILVLNTTSEMLDALGYHVTKFDNGKQAMDYFAQHAEQVDLIVLDMIMPGMSGEDVFKAVKSIKPMQKILLCSGYSQDHIARTLMDAGADGFLGKPYDIKQISFKIKGILHPEIFP
jgi:PAS domain S-box-containing protein